MKSSSTEVGVFVAIAGTSPEFSFSDSRVRVYLDEYSFPFPEDFFRKVKDFFQCNLCKTICSTPSAISLMMALALSTFPFLYSHRGLSGMRKYARRMGMPDKEMNNCKFLQLRNS